MRYTTPAYVSLSCLQAQKKRRDTWSALKFYSGCAAAVGLVVLVDWVVIHAVLGALP